MRSDSHRNLLAVLIVLAATVTSLSATGFQYGIGNNVFHIPYVLRYSELPIFQNDAFYGSLAKFTSIIWPALRLVSSNENVEQIFFISHFLSRCFAFAALFWFFKTNCLSDRNAIIISIAAAAVSPWLMGGSDVGGHGLFLRYFTHSEVTWGPLIAALVAAQNGQLKQSSVFAGIAFLINAFVGIWLAFVISITVLLNNEQRKDWRLILQSSSWFLLICLPVVLWIVISIKDQTPPPAFSYIEYIRAYYPGHFLIESTAGYALRNFGIILYCGLISAYLFRHQRFWVTVIGALLALLLIGCALPYIVNSRFVFNLHLIRSAGVLQFVAIILSLSASGSALLDVTKPRSMRIVATIGVMSFVTFNPEPIYLLSGAASLSLLAFYKLQNTNALVSTAFRRFNLKHLEYATVLVAAFSIVTDFIYTGASLSTIIRWVAIFGLIACLIKYESGKVFTSCLLVIFISIILLICYQANHWRDTAAIQKAPSKITNRLELMNWIKNSQLVGPFLFPIGGSDGSGFDEFQLFTQKTVWVDWKQGAAIMWDPSFYSQWMPRFKEVSSLKTSEDFAEYAIRKGIPYLVVTKAMGNCPPNINVIFSNMDYSICSTEMHSGN